LLSSPVPGCVELRGFGGQVWRTLQDSIRGEGLD